MLRWLPEVASSYGPHVDGVIRLIYGIVGVWFVLALGTLVVLAVAYRRREGRRAAWMPGDGWRRGGVVLVPAALVLAFDVGIDAASADVWSEIHRDLPRADLVVGVTGQQFVWKIRHPGRDGRLGNRDDVETPNNLHVPVGKVVHMRITAIDVIHSFFLPNMRFKIDAVPGRTFTRWFRPTRVGRYQIACAELCGLGHTTMRGWLEVHDRAGYAGWLDAQTPIGR